MAICFAILAHRDRDSLEDLCANILHFCPGAIPVVYDASKDGLELSTLTGALLYPRSRHLRYGHGTRYILDVMEWVISIDLRFDFFVVLDSDVFFIHHGYEAFLSHELSESEYMGIEFHPEPRRKARWAPARAMWKEWKTWRSIVEAKHPYGAFNPGQVFQRSLVRRITSLPRMRRLRRTIAATRTRGMAEVVFPTLAAALNGHPKAYPNPYPFAVSYRPGDSVSLTEVMRFRHHPNCHMVHPVKPLDVYHPVRSWIRSLSGYSR